MALNAEELLILIDELTNDPITRGYSTMSDAEVVDSLRNNVDRAYIRPTMQSHEVFQAIDIAEFNALTDRQQANVTAILGFGTVNPAGKEASLFVNYFGAGSNTITALQTARQAFRSRAFELGIPNVWEPDVTRARQIMAGG